MIRAHSLDVPENTVRNHVSNTCKKPRVYDRTRAVLCAIREELIDVHWMSSG